MSFVYVLIFVIDGGLGGLIELKTYDTFESCKAVATASYRKNQGLWKKHCGLIALGRYACLAKPA